MLPAQQAAPQRPPHRGQEVLCLRKRDWRLRAFIMYHGTKPKNVASIMRHGFWKSDRDRNMLGEGIYVSREYIGRVYIVNKQDHELQKSWHERDSAYVPPNCNMVPSNREETCLREPWQIRVLGVCGYDHLDMAVKSQVKEVDECNETQEEKDEIKNFMHEVCRRVRARPAKLKI